MQQFRALLFHTVVRREKLDKVENKYTLHKSIVLDTCVPKIIKVGRNLTKLWQKRFLTGFIETRCSLAIEFAKITADITQYLS